MLYTPLLIITGLLLVSLITKRLPVFIVDLAYFCNYMFLESYLFDLMSGYELYLTCGIISLFFLKLIRSDFYPALALTIYAAFNLAVSADYLFYPLGGTMIDIYYYILYIPVDLCLIALCAKRGDNNGGYVSKAIGYNNYGMGYISCNTQHLQRMEKNHKWN